MSDECESWSQIPKNNIDPGVKMVVWFQKRISDLERENQHLVNQLSGNLEAIKSAKDESRELNEKNYRLSQNGVSLRTNSAQRQRLLRESKTTIRMLNKQIAELTTRIESMKPKPRRKATKKSTRKTKSKK